MEAKEVGQGTGAGVAETGGDGPGNSFGSMVGAVALGTFTAGLGMLFCVALYKGYWRADETRVWTKTPCVIERAWIEEGRKTHDSPTSYRFRVEYGYRFEGREYTGDRVKRVDGATSIRSKAEGLLEKYPEGLETQCFVNPAVPDEAVLRHDTLAVGYSIWFPGLFVVGGVGIVVSGMRGWLRRRRCRVDESRD